MRAMVSLVVVLSCTAGSGAEAKEPAADSAIQRGLGFLARDAIAWKAEHGCVSCHHAGLVIWAMHAGAQRGNEVDRSLPASLAAPLGALLPRFRPSLPGAFAPDTVSVGQAR
jgi:hypothetical protein